MYIYYIHFSISFVYIYIGDKWYHNECHNNSYSRSWTSYQNIYTFNCTHVYTSNITSPQYLTSTSVQVTCSYQTVTLHLILDENVTDEMCIWHIKQKFVCLWTTIKQTYFMKFVRVAPRSGLFFFWFISFIHRYWIQERIHDFRKLFTNKVWPIQTLHLIFFIEDSCSFLGKLNSKKWHYVVAAPWAHA